MSDGHRAMGDRNREICKDSNITSIYATTREHVSIENINGGMFTQGIQQVFLNNNKYNFNTLINHCHLYELCLIIKHECEALTPVLCVQFVSTQQSLVYFQKQ